MQIEIANTVGSRGVNRISDVFRVQLLLNVWRNSVRLPEITEDGLVGPETLEAINAFQKAKTGWVDGRIDPNGRTLRALREHAYPCLNEALAFIMIGIATTYTPIIYNSNYDIENKLNLPVSEKNLLKIYSFRQHRRR